MRNRFVAVAVSAAMLLSAAGCDDITGASDAREQALTAQLADATEKLGNLDENNRRLQEDLQRALSDRDTWRRQVDELMVKVAERDAEIAKLQADARDSRKRSDELMKNFEKINAELQAIRAVLETKNKAAENP